MPVHLLVTGAAGFIGSQLVDRLLAAGHRVTGLDNFCRGTQANLAAALAQPGFRFVEVNLHDLEAYQAAVATLTEPVDAVWHMAANSDIPAGVSDPAIDLRDTFATTYNTLQVMRRLAVRKLAFASTSAVYGDLPQVLTEDSGPLLPISNYGAMKLAAEAAISAACESFLDQACVFRFPNVVGPRATHGILLDLLRKLGGGAAALEVLGDGSQQKQYLHVSELVDAMLFITAQAPEKRAWYNIGPPDEGIFVRDIAAAVVAEAAPGRPIRYSGGSRGWLGDVPKFRYSVEKLRQLGWSTVQTSQQAIGRAVREIHLELSR